MSHFLHTHGVPHDIDRTPAWLIGALSAASGPISIPFVFGYHLASVSAPNAEVPTFWEEVKIGAEYGLGYWIMTAILERTVGPAFLLGQAS